MIALFKKKMRSCLHLANNNNNNDNNNNHNNSHNNHNNYNNNIKI